MAVVHQPVYHVRRGSHGGHGATRGAQFGGGGYPSSAHLGAPQPQRHAPVPAAASAAGGSLKMSPPRGHSGLLTGSGQNWASRAQVRHQSQPRARTSALAPGLAGRPTSLLPAAPPRAPDPAAAAAAAAQRPVGPPAGARRGAEAVVAAAAAVAAEPPRWYAAPTPSPSPSPERQEHGRSAVASAPSLAPPMPGLGGGATARISVVAPGAGTGANAAVYAELGRMPDFRLDIKGQARAPYDRYPASWQGGAAGPNLETFAAQLMDQGIVEQSECLVVGSRGGQVVLPSLWSRFGDGVPPAVVINGGCAMGLPTAVYWPTQAVTFLLIGGQDNFRGKASVEEYIADTKSRVPKGSSRTAILYVSEMQHMPQSALLGAVLPQMVRALLAWKRAGASAPPPHDKMQAVLAAVKQQKQWSGCLMYTCGAGVWQDLPFGGATVAEKVAPQRPWQPAIAAFGGA